MANRPGFFKFFLPSLGLENQKIPPRFIQSIRGTWPMNLVLRDCYNNLWHVKVEKVGDDWYFEDGWKKFSDENMIKGGDLLVYEYSSRGLLDFKVHDGSACLTKGVGCHITKNTEEQNTTTVLDDDDDDDDIGHTHENGYHRGERVIDDDSDDIGYDPRTEEDNRQDAHPQVEQVVIIDTDDDCNALTSEEDDKKIQCFEAVEVTDDDNDAGDCFPTTEEANRRDACPTGKELVIGCQYMQTGEMDLGRTQRGGPGSDYPRLEQRTAAGTSKRKKTTAHDWYGVDIFRTGLIPQPKNPYFVTKRRQRAAELYIPMDVIKGYCLKLPEIIVLLDPKGRPFRARRKVWSDERTFYVGGWKALCGMNMVGGEDNCICEFVQKGGDLCISVSFFPPKES